MDVRLFVVFSILGGTYALTGKGFYCRDPDTGKLHAVNSTWKSETFCGNYTCKIKKKDPPPSAPLREFKVSDVDISRINNYNVENKSLSAFSNEDDNNRLVVNISGASIPEVENKLINPHVFEEKRIATILNKILTNITESTDKAKHNDENSINKTDRYLNDKEIKLISDLLHGVKKSDLETVVDIYNLAQDIYKELDKKTTETVFEEAVSEMKDQGNKVITTSEPKMAHNKFLYNPSHYSQKTINNLKKQDSEGFTASYPITEHNQILYRYVPIQKSQKLINDLKYQQNEKLTAFIPKIDNNELNGYESVQDSIKTKNELDMNTEGTDVIPLVNFAPNMDNHVTTSALSGGEYGKLPYYFQMSDFQRQSSYMHPPSSYSTTEGSSSTQSFTEKPPQKSRAVNNPIDNQQIQYSKPILLPYPYYQVRYNASGYPFNYFYGVNPYQDIYRKEYNPYYVARISYADNVQFPERSYKPGTLVDTILPKEDSKTTKSPDWKTDSLTDDVIDDIRAHFENKNILFKPICLKKKVKLEKVGKVFKLDDFNRKKRSVNEDQSENKKADEMYEVYIEKTTCQSDVDPGFFRIGNLTAPFPACCPQRISR